MTIPFDIFAKSNASLNLELRLVNNITDVPIDLTGFDAKMHIRERKEGFVLIAQLDTTGTLDGTITMGGVLGTIGILMPPTVLEQKFRQGNWKYDIVLIDPSSVYERLSEGSFQVDGSVTFVS